MVTSSYLFWSFLNGDRAHPVHPHGFQRPAQGVSGHLDGKKRDNLLQHVATLLGPSGWCQCEEQAPVAKVTN